MDRSYGPITPEFEIASTVLATVISRKRDTLVVDCGTKTIDVQLELPVIAGHVASARYVAEEHLVFDVPRSCELILGSTVELVPAQCGSTVNLHDAHYVVERDVVIDVWRVLARGPGRPSRCDWERGQTTEDELIRPP
jgi:D-serine deaminase-like pyridoxal phosphate-dependent protein